MPRWTIVGLNKQTLGHVHGKNKGAALQAAVDQGLVTGKKKIGSAVALPAPAVPPVITITDIETSFFLASAILTAQIG